MMPQSIDVKPVTRDRILRRQQDFERVLFRGRRLKQGPLSLYLAPGAEAVGRVAFIATGRFRSAVMRNRVRRRLREVFRTSRAAFPQNQDLILRGDAGAAALEFAEFRSEILSLAALATGDK